MRDPDTSPVPSTGCVPVDIQLLSMRNGWRAERSDDVRLLLVVIEGQGALRIHGRRCKVRHGQCIWVEPGISVRAGTKGECGFRLFVCAFLLFSAGSAPQVETGSSGFVCWDGIGSGSFAKTVMHLQELLRHGRSAEFGRQLRNQAIFQEIMLAVWSEAGDGPPSSRHNSRKAVERAAAYLEAHFDRDIDIERLVADAMIGKRYFNRLFRELTGSSVTEYVTTLRMNHARHLLSQSGSRVKDVASAVGYRDEFYFNRKFKQSFGVAPGQYSRNLKYDKKLFATQYLGHLLSLGIRPVGATSNVMSHSFLRELVEGIESVDQPLSVERVGELDPDLIIGWEPSDEEKLSAVAPVVLLPYGEGTSMDHFLRLADMLDKRKEARQWIDRYEAKAKRLRKTLDGAVGPRETVSIIEVWGHGIVVYGNRWGRGGYNLYNGLELNPPEPVLQHLIDKEPYRMITLEQLPAYAGDRVFLTVYGEGGGAERAKEMKASRIWADLPAVKRGCVYEVDIQRFGAGDPISLSRQLDIQVRLLRTGGRGRTT